MNRQRTANKFPPAQRSAFGGMSPQCITETSGGWTKWVTGTTGSGIARIGPPRSRRCRDSDVQVSREALASPSSTPTRKRGQSGSVLSEGPDRSGQEHGGL